MAAEIATDIAKLDVAGRVISGVIEQIRNVVQLDEKLHLLKNDFSFMNPLLLQIHQQFQQQQRRLPENIEVCLTSMSQHFTEGERLINRANRQRGRCFGCFLICNPNLFTQITDWKTVFDQHFQELQRVFSITANTAHVVSTAAHQEEILLQPVPDSGFVGSAIEPAQKQLHTWLGEVHPQARMIGVYGIGGIGKTTLLRLVYNHYKKVRGVFDVVIWLTISQNYQIEKLQASIAESLDLRLHGISNSETCKMKLSESLGKKKFLLILDDMWRPIDLINDLGVAFGNHNCSKILMSSRSRDVIGIMGASDDYSLRIQPLSTEEGWVLFRREAFTNGAVPKEGIEAVARKIASECQGLPLALTVVAAAMRLKKTEEEWSRALNLMRNVDPSFRASHSSIDANLYERLTWSYDDIADRSLKICFLYCGVFPEDAEINVETLVEMWSAEKLVTHTDAGHEYIDVLVRRGLMEYVFGHDGMGETLNLLDGRRSTIYAEKRVKVHDVLRDLAIYIGRSEEKWLFGTGHHLQAFPSEDEIRDCKRISAGHNDIQDLPTDLICSQLVSLALANNEKIRELPERFLSTAMSLKVLDLSQCTSITSLPTSVGQLRQLEFLKLTGCCRLENLPDSTGNLSRLKFLNLQHCQLLNSLPDSIGELRNLKRLNLERCDSLRAIPAGIAHLTSLNKLVLPMPPWARRNCPISAELLADLSNLMELTADVKSEMKEGAMTTWTDMRRLTLSCFDAARDDVVEDIFPFNMENVNKLEYFSLQYYQGVSLPNGISQFQNLRTLSLLCCSELKELPIGGGFPRLKKLELRDLEKLESMVGSSVVSSEETMPELEDIQISYCSSLKRLGTKKLPSLKKLYISSCNEFEELEMGSGGLPMLETLRLQFVEKFQILVGPSGVIDEGVMPKLQHLDIFRCPLLKRLGIEKLTNLRQVGIYSCSGLTQLEIGSGGFSMLESLTLSDCENLENMVGPPDAWNDEAMPKIKVLKIIRCPLLRKMPMGIEKLSNLEQIIGELEWWQNIIWVDDTMENTLSKIFINSDDSMDLGG